MLRLWARMVDMARGVWCSFFVRSGALQDPAAKPKPLRVQVPKWEAYIRIYIYIHIPQTIVMIPNTETIDTL